MKQSLRIVLAIVLLSGLGPRMAVADIYQADAQSIFRSASQTLYLGVVRKIELMQAQLAVLASSAAKFDEWAEREWEDRGWITDLPRCSCNRNELNMSDTGDKGFMQDGNPNLKKDHPGADICFRSNKNHAGHAQQCCYDKNGKLITFGPAAGTPDRAATSSLKNPIGFFGHQPQDMKPVGWAAAKIHMLNSEHNTALGTALENVISIWDHRDAWILYNAVRDDPRASDPDPQKGCPQNPSNSIRMRLVINGNPTTVLFNNGKRFLTPDEVMPK